MKQKEKQVRTKKHTLSRGILSSVAKDMGISRQAVTMKIIRKNDPVALELAAKYEKEYRLRMKKSIKTYQEVIDIQVQ